MIRRRLAICSIAVAAVLAISVPAFAYWTAQASASGNATAAVMGSFAASATASADASKVTISVSGVTGPAPTSWVVSRTAPNTSGGCTITAPATSCNDTTGIAQGTTYSYNIVAKLGNWTGAEKSVSTTTSTLSHTYEFRVVGAQPTTGTAGAAINLTIQAYKDGLIETGYVPTALSITGANIAPDGTVPAVSAGSWSSGQTTVSLTLVKSESETVTIKDGTASPAQHSLTLAPITVSPSSANKVAWTSPSVSSGSLITPCLFTCTAKAVGNFGTFTASVSITDALGNIISGVGVAKTVNLSMSANPNGSYTSPTSGSTTTLTIPATGPATSSATFTYKAGNGNWTADALTAAVTGYSSATANVTKQ
jgi:hypothetical protein